MTTKPLTFARWLTGRREQRLPDLGGRELAVLEVLWTEGQATAQSVLRQMPGGDVSLSTVQSTLERLHRKQLIQRAKQGRAYCYEAVLTQPQLIGGLLRDMADDVADGELAPMLSGFVDYLSGRAPELGADVSRALRLPRAGKDEEEEEGGHG